MQPTLIGIFILLIGGFLLVYRGIEEMLVLVMACMLMGGSAALILPALGSSSVPPVSVATGFLLLRIVFTPNQGTLDVKSALSRNLFFLLFGAYAIVSAVVMPRLFAGAIDVVPLRPISVKSLYDVVPLQFTPQNVTSAFYIGGSCVLATCAFIVMRCSSGAITFVKAGVVISWIHIIFGVAGAVLPKAVWSPFSAIFRNGSYASLSQEIDGYSRITGIMSEPSAYAGFGIPWVVVLTECWLRDVLPRRTGPAAGVMALVLIASTSSTAYVGIAGYAILLLLRMLIFPQFFKGTKILWIAGSAVIIITLAMALMVFNTSLLNAMTRILRLATVDKMNSDSGLQRAFWAKQGIAAFQVSHGLGIGAGSFRSSNIVTAILGSMGVVGIGCYLFYLAVVFRPLSNSTYGPSRDPLEAVGVSCAWAVVALVMPSLAAAASPDPGSMFAMLAGASLGLRSLPFYKRRPEIAAPTDDPPLQLGRNKGIKKLA